MTDPTLLEKVQAANPFGQMANVLGKAAGTTPATPATPATPVKAAPASLPSGPNVLVDWVHPVTGKRMSTTAAERDAVLTPPTTKPVTVPRSLSKGGR